MLYKNGEIYNLTKEERAQFQKKHVWVIDPSKYQWNSENRRWVLPRQMVMTSYTSYNEQDGMVEIRYATSTSQNPNNPLIKNFTPVYIDLGAEGVIEASERDYELNWYLFNTPYNASNPKRDEKAEKQYFLFSREDHFRNKSKVSRQQAEALAELWSEDKPMAEEKIRTIARSMNANGLQIHADVVTGPLLELKSEIDAYIKNKPNDYFAAVGDQMGAIRKILNKAAQAGIIEYDRQNKSWRLKPEDDSKPVEIILKNQTNDDPHVVLERHLATQAGRKVFEKIINRTTVTV